MPNHYVRLPDLPVAPLPWTGNEILLGEQDGATKVFRLADLSIGTGYSTSNASTAAIPAGAAVAPNPHAAGVVLAYGGNPAFPAVGLAAAPAAVGAAVRVETGGVLTLPDWSAVTDEATPSLQPNATYFLSSYGGGSITVTMPSSSGAFVQPVGRALTSDTLLIDVGTPILL